jgi:hypothetical protein
MSWQTTVVTLREAGCTKGASLAANAVKTCPRTIALSIRIIPIGTDRGGTINVQCVGDGLELPEPFELRCCLRTLFHTSQHAAKRPSPMVRVLASSSV